MPVPRGNERSHSCITVVSRASCRFGFSGSDVSVIPARSSTTASSRRNTKEVVDSVFCMAGLMVDLRDYLVISWNRDRVGVKGE